MIKKINLSLSSLPSNVNFLFFYSMKLGSILRTRIFIGAANSSVRTSTRSGISTGREGPVVPVPEPVLPFQD